MVDVVQFNTCQSDALRQSRAICTIRGFLFFFERFFLRIFDATPRLPSTSTKKEFYKKISMINKL